jgi:hypothetical protein
VLHVQSGRVHMDVKGLVCRWRGYRIASRVTSDHFKVA